jgi:CO dehydrogenase maturation factor
MRIAFVGKGGSGKSTITASFASYTSKNTDKPVVVFDADLNIHAPELLGFNAIAFEKHLSHPSVTKIIKQWLIGENDIPSIGSFRKTTPPTSKSNIIKITELQNTPLIDFGLHKNKLSVFAVGTYQDNDIGASCYHNNLSIFESVLSHFDDKSGYLVADMVAGVDSFAGTLHAQFDITCLIVEPTRRGVEVYEKYNALATEAGVVDNLIVVGNKVRSEADEKFIKKYVGADKLLGCFVDDEHIRHIDQTEEFIDIEKMNDHNIKLLALIKTKLEELPDSRNIRLRKIWELHKKYVSQDFIKERFGDLSGQIDSDFRFK